MKKLFTLLIAFMLALSFNAMAQWNTYASVEPSADEPVYKLDVIKLDFGHSIGGVPRLRRLNLQHLMVIQKIFQ